MILLASSQQLITFIDQGTDPIYLFEKFGAFRLGESWIANDLIRNAISLILRQSDLAGCNVQDSSLIYLNWTETHTLTGRIIREPLGRLTVLCISHLEEDQSRIDEFLWFPTRLFPSLHHLDHCLGEPHCCLINRHVTNLAYFFLTASYDSPKTYAYFAM